MIFRVPFIVLLMAGLAAGQQGKPPESAPTDPKDLGSIAGKAVAPGGAPLRKSKMTLRPVQTKPGEAVTPFTATADAQGVFLFEGMEPGRYLLVAEHAGYLTTSYGAKKLPGAGTVLTLGKGQKMADLVVELVPQAIISGKVLDDEGDPLGKVRVTAMHSAYMNGKRRLMVSGNAMTDELGEYKMSNLAPGRYLLSASLMNNMFGDATRQAGVKPDAIEERLVTTYYAGVIDSAAATPLEVSAGHDLPGTNITLHKAQVFRVRGTVAGIASAPSSQNLRVMLTPKAESSGFMGFGGEGGAIQKDGTFEVRGLQPGSYIISVLVAEGMLRRLVTQPLEVGSRNVDGVTLMVREGGAVTGSVRRDGQPAAPDTVGYEAIRLSLQTSEGLVFNAPNATVKADGSFSFTDVIPDKYHVSAYGLPTGTYLKWIHYGTQDALVGADIAPGGVLEIMLGVNPGKIDGTVTVEEQKNVRGTTVTLIPDPPAPERPDLNRTAAADQSGHFTLTDIAPGKYRVYAWEELENGAQLDPEFMKPLEGKGTKITMDANGSQSVEVPRIPVEQVAAAKTQ